MSCSRVFIFPHVALVEFGTRYHGCVCVCMCVCARRHSTYSRKSSSVLSVTTTRFRVIPWNASDLTGRINTTGHVLSVTDEKRVTSASSRLITVVESERTVFASSCKQYAICSACASLPLDAAPLLQR